MTTDANLTQEARLIEQAARQAIAADTAAMPADAKLLPAMPVRTLAGALQGWFVPLVAQDRLVGFMRFTAQRELAGRSSFMRGSGRIDHCPLATDWLDKESIRGSAMALAAPGEDAGAPLLSFDGVPDRLAWAVPLRSPNRTAPRWIFVAGTAAWAGSSTGLG